MSLKSTGKMNGYDVICASDMNGNCLKSSLLVTVKRGADSNETLNQLFDASAKDKAVPMNVPTPLDKNKSEKEIIKIQNILDDSSRIVKKNVITNPFD